MRRPTKTVIAGWTIALLTSVSRLPATAADSLLVELDMLSGLPNPVYTLKDSGSVALLRHRMGAYQILSSSGWTGCPRPRTGLGYRGVNLGDKNSEPAGWVAASNGSLSICPPLSSAGSLCRTYCDYRCELERMALRACVREKAVPSAILGAIPDSLLRPVTRDGVFTLMQGNREEFTDFSLMRTDHVMSRTDTVLVGDAVITTSPAAWNLRAYYGVVDKGKQPGFPPVTGPDLGGPAAGSAWPVLRSRFEALRVVIPSQGFRDSVEIALDIGHLYIVRTSEGGFCALVVSGLYIGGINRCQIYYLFTTDSAFPATAAAARGLGRRGMPAHAGRGWDAGAVRVFGLDGAAVRTPGRPLPGVKVRDGNRVTQVRVVR